MGYGHWAFGFILYIVIVYSIGESTRQRTIWNDRDSSKAIDGDITTCSETGLHTRPWWMWDLETSTLIKGINITGQDLKNVFVYVGDTPVPFVVDDATLSDYNLCYNAIDALEPGKEHSLTCDVELNGRYVIVYTIRSTPKNLTICDFKLF